MNTVVELEGSRDAAAMAKVMARDHQGPLTTRLQACAAVNSRLDSERNQSGKSVPFNTRYLSSSDYETFLLRSGCSAECLRMP
jgi:hypothetical protein